MHNPSKNSAYLTGASLTHPGKVRNNNEDVVLYHIPEVSNGDRRGLFIVADGVGGHLAGEVASKLAVKTICDSLKDFLDGEFIINFNDDLEKDDFFYESYLGGLLKATVEQANYEVFEYSLNNQAEAANLSTTLTCGLVNGSILVIAHVGDSRAYRLRRGALEQITRDHTFVGEMVRNGSYPPSAVYDHPRRHMIIRALGREPSVNVDIEILQIQEGDRLLFCSDGLWEMVRDSNITKILSSAGSPQEAVERLFESAMEAGGEDNIGVVIGDIHGR
jgi:protein phosphatase